MDGGSRLGCCDGGVNGGRGSLLFGSRAGSGAVERSRRGSSCDAAATEPLRRRPARDTRSSIVQKIPPAQTADAAAGGSAAVTPSPFLEELKSFGYMPIATAVAAVKVVGAVAPSPLVVTL